MYFEWRCDVVSISVSISDQQFWIFASKLLELCTIEFLNWKSVEKLAKHAIFAFLACCTTQAHSTHGSEIFDETRNGERASEKKKEKEPQPIECLCLHFVLVTGTRRDNPLLSAMSRVGSRQRCWGWTSWTCCGVFMSPKQVSFFLFRTVLVSKNCRSNKGFSGRWSRIWNPCYHMRHEASGISTKMHQEYANF